MSKAHFPVSVLGPGKRIALWTQGCSIGCIGCSARDTWASSSTGEYDVAIADLISLCAQWLEQGATGITLTGGEPFDQPDALRILVTELRGLITDLGLVDAGGVDLVAYSGRSLGWLRKNHQVLLGLLDAVLVGPYISGRPAQRAWRGSENQELIAMTALGRERWKLDPDEATQLPRLQLSVQDEQVWMIGMPRPGDLEAFESRLRSAGLRLEQVSWRS